MKAGRDLNAGQPRLGISSRAPACATSDPIPILSSGMPLKKLLDMVEGFGPTSLHQGPNSRNQYNLTPLKHLGTIR